MYLDELVMNLSVTLFFFITFVKSDDVLDFVIFGKKEQREKQVGWGGESIVPQFLAVPHGETLVVYRISRCMFICNVI